jgi:hypothetical protein
MKILATDVPALWRDFLSGGVARYQEAAAAFQKNQPELATMLKDVDEKWFSAKTDHVLAYGTFIWKAITTVYGQVDRVPQNLIDALSRGEEEFYAALEDESEFEIKKAMENRRRSLPEPALANHIEREFQEGSARAKELNPVNNAIAVRALLLTIDALVRSRAGADT